MVMSPRLAAALRFAFTISAVNLLAYGLFGPGTASTSASFAVISSLYFLDYDGSTRERVGAYSASALVAFLGLGVGIVVSGHTLSIVIAAFIIGFGFAAARALRGFIARSFIGAQLAFVLAVFTQDAPAHSAELFTGWGLGAVISLIAALTIFPRQHSGVLREALSAWALAAAHYVRASDETRSAATQQLQQRRDALNSVDRGDMIAGLWSARTRSLAAMVLQVHQVTALLDLIPQHRHHSQSALAEESAHALENAAAMVRIGAVPHEFSSLVHAREADFEQARQLFAKTANKQDIAQRLDVRVFSIASESMEVLAAASQGWKHPSWSLIIEPEHSLISVIKRALRTDSVWLFHGLRTGFALAASILIATLLGLDHGVWVVMTTLAVINISYTTSGSAKTALGAVAGMLSGVLFSVGLIYLNPSWAVMAVAVTGLAILAKWLLPTTQLFAQMSYTPFAVANATLLGWPEQHGINIERAEDIFVGVVVGVLATILTFPFGMKKLLTRSWNRARTDALAALEQVTRAVRENEPVDSHLARAQSLSFSSATDVVDTVFVGSVKLGAEFTVVVERLRWLNLALLGHIGIAHLWEMQKNLPPADPGCDVVQLWSQEAWDSIVASEPTTPAEKK